MTKNDPFEFIKPETRQRCKIFTVDSNTERKFIRINGELFHYLYDVNKIDFTVYFRIENTMIEFMKANEFSKELLDKIWAAMESSKRQIQINILKADQLKLNRVLMQVRQAKVNQLLEKDPYLDKKTLDIFSNLSNASQLVVKGGITNEVTMQIEASAAHMVNNLFDSQSAISTLSRMVVHDPTLYDHSASVAMMAAVIGKTCLSKPLSTKDLMIVSKCGLYHDVGKTCVPSGVLNKPGGFTNEEYAVMKTHAELGEKELLKIISEGAKIDEIAARVAGEHHERFYGNGYPRGRSGRFEEDPDNGIHLFSRIVTIADVYSALLMKRVYKPAYEAQDAIKIMAEVATKEYDPEIFPKFLNSVIGSLNAYQEKHSQKSKGRILYLDEQGVLREKEKKAV